MNVRFVLMSVTTNTECKIIQKLITIIWIPGTRQAFLLLFTRVLYRKSILVNNFWITMHANCK